MWCACDMFTGGESSLHPREIRGLHTARMTAGDGAPRPPIPCPPAPLSRRLSSPVIACCASHVCAAHRTRFVSSRAALIHVMRLCADGAPVAQDGSLASAPAWSPSWTWAQMQAAGSAVRPARTSVVSAPTCGGRVAPSCAVCVVCRRVEAAWSAACVLGIRARASRLIVARVALCTRVCCVRVCGRRAMLCCVMRDACLHVRRGVLWRGCKCAIEELPHAPNCSLCVVLILAYVVCARGRLCRWLASVGRPFRVGTYRVS